MIRSKSRRRFLRAASLGAGAAAGWAGFATAMREAFALPGVKRTGTIRDVEHVVILTQENRSFDHYFGCLRGVRGFNDPRPVTLPDGRPVWYQPPATVHTKEYAARGLPERAPYVLPHYLDPRRTSAFQPGTDHGWSSGHLAWNEGRHDQWVNQKQDVLTMGYLMRRDLPMHYALADAFTVCDAYFCSTPADTAPNRIYMWTGTIDPRNVHGKSGNGPGLEERNRNDGYSWTTYPERLQAHGIDWKVYQGGTGLPGDATDNYTNNSLEFFAAYQVAQGAAGPLVDRGAAQHTLAEFSADVRHGRLPQVSWIVAPQQYCEHPSASPADGAYYIGLVLQALTSNPQVWGKTVLLINYDENDGLFDHVVPPVPPLASGRDAQGMVSAALIGSLADECLDLDRHPRQKTPLIPGADPGGVQAIGLGPRVPLLVVSPWSKGGWTCSEVFDHTSIIRFLETRFGVAEPNISAWRRAVCGDLTSAFDFSGEPDTALPVASAPRPAARGGAPVRMRLPQAMPRQEPGARPARALPYRLLVHARTRGEPGRVWLDFANAGAAGAHFYVYDRLDAAAAPRRYTVAAGDTLSDYWTARGAQRAFHLSAYGPNGYLCEFSGRVGDDQASAGPMPEAAVAYIAQPPGLALTLRNDGARGCEIRVVNTYDPARPRTYTLAPGATLQDHWDLAHSRAWYDLRVSAQALPGFTRRFAGHVENGQPGWSDPGVPARFTASAPV